MSGRYDVCRLLCSIYTVLGKFSQTLDDLSIIYVLLFHLVRKRRIGLNSSFSEPSEKVLSIRIQSKVWVYLLLPTVTSDSYV